MTAPASCWTVQPGLAAKATQLPVIASEAQQSRASLLHSFRPALLLLLLTAPGALAAPASLTISHAWIRYITPTLPAAGYFTLANNTDHVVTLDGATSPDCGQLMLHQSIVQNGTAKMQMVSSIPVLSHGSVTFSPGAYHLMCMSPSAVMKPGQTVPITLHFLGGASLDATFPVRTATGK